MAETTPAKRDVQCPHCGHFVGPALRCARCGMRLEKRMGLRLLRFCALVTAIGGLLLLHFYSRHRELPLVQIGEISPVMNFASVRVEGVLESDARPVRGGSTLYVVDDGTGTLAVFANQAPAGKLPKAGSRISIAGSLSVGAGNEMRMSARSAGHVVFESGPMDEAFVSDLNLSHITAEQDGARITVQGRVSRVWKPKPGSKAPYKIVLEDAGGTLDAVHWLKDFTPPEIGDELEISGTVGVYKETVQLRIWSKEDIQPLEKEPVNAGVLNVVQITAAMEKQWVTVEGVLGPPRSIPGGVVYPLDDGSGSIQVLFWDRNVSGEERDVLDEGVRVRIEAPVVVYKGILELIPEDMGAFHTLE